MLIIDCQTDDSTRRLVNKNTTTSFTASAVAAASTKSKFTY